MTPPGQLSQFNLPNLVEEKQIPVLLPAKTTPNAKAFRLWNHWPVDVVAQENRPEAAIPNPTP